MMMMQNDERRDTKVEEWEREIITQTHKKEE
jgi:hypothetical protein